MEMENKGTNTKTKEDFILETKTGNEFLTLEDEIYTRPSWCDANFALKKIQKNEGKGNMTALKVRAFIQSALYKLGLFANNFSLHILFSTAIVLAGCTYCLSFAEIETDLQKLWVEDGNVLKKDQEYHDSSYRVSDEILQETLSDGGWGTRSSIEFLVQISNNDIENIMAFRQHLHMAMKAVNTTVFMFGRSWTFLDLCLKPPFDIKSGLGRNKWFDSIIEQFLDIVPCIIITPLDCFWEGAKLIGPAQPFRSTGKPLTWKNMKPVEDILDYFINSPIFGSLAAEFLKPFRSLFIEAGIVNGYQKRYCLNPHDPECPTTAPNYKDKKDPPIKEILKKGCTGFASEVLKWPKDVIISPFSKNDGVRNQAAQTIFQIDGSRQIYLKHKKLKIEDWSPKKANEVALAWRRKFTTRMNKGLKDYSLGGNISMTYLNSTSKFYGFNEASFVDVLLKYSTAGVSVLVGGYALMVIYAYLTMRKRSYSLSQGGVSLAGVVLVLFSVSSGLGVSCKIGIKFNPASLQVLPFLMLGLGVDDMFLLASHFAHVSNLQYIPVKKRTGECLKRVGVSVLLTSVSILSAFLSAMIIPMPALRDFSKQAALVTLFNLVVVLVAFPAMLSLDLRRRNNEKLDLFCCIKRKSTKSKSGNHNEAFVVTECKSDQKDEVTKCKKLNNSLEEKQSFFKRLKLQYFKVTEIFDSSYFITKCYAPLVLNSIFQVVVLFITIIAIGFSVYGATLLKDGLDISDVIPRDTIEYDAIKAQFDYFTFYPVEIITKEFDYSKQQNQILSLHKEINASPYFVKETDGSFKKMWLNYFVEWLQKLQTKFDEDWLIGNVNKSAYAEKAHEDTKLAWKLLIQTGVSSSPLDYERIGCRNESSTCLKIDKVRLVDDFGIIREDAFYCYLTAWSNVDVISYEISQANIVPIPPDWDKESNLITPSLQPVIAKMFYFVSKLRKHEDYIKLIKHTRKVCESHEKSGDFGAYPMGYPFLFWQQYIDLRYWLFIALAVVLSSSFVVLSLTTMNLYTGFLVTVMLLIILTEMIGYMGLVGVRLSSLPAVCTISAVGIGLEFVVHIVLAFLTTTGTKEYRVTESLKHTTGPVLDGGISTLLGVIMLAAARFEFIIKYFLQLLLVLIVLGLLNGLVLLPIILYYIGPKCEVKLKTITAKLQTKKSKE